MDNIPSQQGVVSLAPFRHLFQWSDEEEEVSGYASSASISSVRTWLVSANMTDNNNDDDLHHRMEAHEQTSRAQQEALENIQQMLAQFLTNWNNNDTTGSNHERKKTSTMNLLRLKSQRKVFQLMSMLSKASKLR